MHRGEMIEIGKGNPQLATGQGLETFRINDEIQNALKGMRVQNADSNQGTLNLMRQLCRFGSPTELLLDDPFKIVKDGSLKFEAKIKTPEVLEVALIYEDDPQKKLEAGLAKFEKGKYRESAPYFADLIKYVRDNLPDGDDRNGKLCALLYYSALAKSRPDPDDPNAKTRKGGSVDAIPEFKEAVELAKKLKLPSEKIADIEREQAGNLLALGPKHAKDARKILEDAVKRLDAAKDKPDPMMKAMILGDLGQAKVALAGQVKDDTERKALYAEAESDLKASYAIITKAVKDETEKAKKSPKEVQLLLTIAKIVDVLRKQGKGDDKEAKKYGLELLELEKKYPINPNGSDGIKIDP